MLFMGKDAVLEVGSNGNYDFMIVIASEKRARKENEQRAKKTLYL